MKVKFNLDILQHILNDILQLTGISISFLDTDFNYVALNWNSTDYCSLLQKQGDLRNICNCSDYTLLNKCKQSKKTQSHICHAGLLDLAFPISKNEIIVGYVLIGRIKSKISPQNNPYTQFENVKYQLDMLYQKIPCFTTEKVESLLDLLSRILFQNAIDFEIDNYTNLIAEYIDNNLTEDLRLDTICSKFFISKNRLYEIFHNGFDCTVNEYIIKARIQKAISLLKDTKKTIFEISESVGIRNYTYFCKLFKKEVGITATEFRAIW